MINIKKLLISIIAAVLICAVCVPVIMTVLWDLEIGIATPVGSNGQYIEQVMITGGMYTTKEANRQSREFMDKCYDFTKKFHEEHKDDKYKIKLSVDIKDGKTIATYKGTITDKETGETTPYEEKLVFDYVFTRTVMN